MTFDEFQARASATAVYPASTGLMYCALGLAGEAGEVANKVKKIARGDYNGKPDEAERVRQEIVKELGDVLWYVAMVATECDTALGDVARMNVEKLAARAARGTLQGEGDNR